MFEKPQYFTANGLRREAINPQKKKIELIRQEKLKQKRMALLEKNRALKNSSARPHLQRKTISKEAAKVLAIALKGMLNS